MTVAQYILDIQMQGSLGIKLLALSAAPEQREEDVVWLSLIKTSVSEWIIIQDSSN